MNWDDVLDRLTCAGLGPREETYMEHYGKVLAVQRPEFTNRIIRCTYGKVRCEGSCELVDLEIYLFPSEVHLQDFMELLTDQESWTASGNVAVHFPPCDAESKEAILKAILSEERKER
jgi:hypothetical protein